jgi:hypothetical protein
MRSEREAARRTTFTKLDRIIKTHHLFAISRACQTTEGFRFAEKWQKSVATDHGMLQFLM